MIIRIVFALGLDTSKPHYGMSTHYVELAYMLASGGGYNTILLDDNNSSKTLAMLSLELSKVGKKICTSTKLPFDRNNTTPEYWRPPGYPIFLLILYWLFGEPLFLFATITQAIIGAFIPILIYFIGIKLFNEKIAICSMWLGAIYPPLLFIQLQVLPDSFQILFILFALYYFIYGIFEKKTKYLIFTGFTIGIGFLFRPEIIILIPLFSLILLVLYRTSKITIKGIIIIFICSSLFIAPWVIRNHNKTGYWYITTGTWAVTWQGIGDRVNKWGATLSDEDVDAMAKKHGFHSWMAPDADKWFKQKVLQCLVEDPLFFLIGAIHRLPEVVATPFDLGYVNPSRTKGFKSYFRLEKNLNTFQTIFQNKVYVIKAFWDRWIIAFISLIAMFSMIFMAIRNRRDFKKWIIFLSIPGCFMLIRVGTLADFRYLTPVIPFQLMALSFIYFEVKGYLKKTDSTFVKK